MNRLYVNEKGAWREVRHVHEKLGDQWIEVPREQWRERIQRGRDSSAVRIVFGLLALLASAFARRSAALLDVDLPSEEQPMALSDCPKCWNTPCTCGWEYRDWSLEAKRNLARAILGELALLEAQKIVTKLREDDTLYVSGPHTYENDSPREWSLDGSFTADELEALAIVLRSSSPGQSNT